MSTIKFSFVGLICLAAIPSAAHAKLVVYYDVLATRVETPQMEDWISIRTIQATGQEPAVTKREIDKGVKQAFDDGFKRVRVRKTIADDSDFTKKPETKEEDVSRENGVPMTLLQAMGDGESADSSPPEPPAEGKPKPEKWEMWLEEKKDGQWVEVPDRRYPYTDYEKFALAFADYDKTIKGLNQSAVRYRLRWRAVESKPTIETPEIKTVDLGPKPKSDFRGGTFGQDFGYDGYRFITLSGDGTGTLKMKGQSDTKREYDIKWSLTDEGWVDVEKVRITAWSFSTEEPDNPLIGREANRARVEEDDSWLFDKIAWKVESDGLNPVWAVANARGKPAEHRFYHFKRGE